MGERGQEGLLPERRNHVLPRASHPRVCSQRCPVWGWRPWEPVAPTSGGNVCPVTAWRCATCSLTRTQLTVLVAAVLSPGKECVSTLNPLHRPDHQPRPRWETYFGN